MNRKVLTGAFGVIALIAIVATFGLSQNWFRQSVSSAGTTVGMCDGWVFHMENENRDKALFVAKGQSLGYYQGKVICPSLETGSKHTCYYFSQDGRIEGKKTFKFEVKEVFPDSEPNLSRKKVKGKIKELPYLEEKNCTRPKVLQLTAIFRPGFNLPGQTKQYWEAKVICEREMAFGFLKISSSGKLQTVSWQSFPDPGVNKSEFMREKKRIGSLVFCEEEARKLGENFLKKADIRRELGEGYHVEFSLPQAPGFISTPTKTSEASKAKTINESEVEKIKNIMRTKE